MLSISFILILYIYIYTRTLGLGSRRVQELSAINPYVFHFIIISFVLIVLGGIRSEHFVTTTKGFASVSVAFQGFKEH